MKMTDETTRPIAVSLTVILTMVALFWQWSRAYASDQATLTEKVTTVEMTVVRIDTEAKATRESIDKLTEKIEELSRQVERRRRR